MTTPQPVTATRTVDRQQREADRERVRWLARVLDTQFEVAGVRFGVDALAGLIPGVGDTLTALIGLYPLYIARRHGLGRLALTRMGGNLLLDWLVGAIPLAGDLFDVAFKANTRNLKILLRALEQQDSQPG